MAQTMMTDAEAVLGGLRIVDGDAHFTEPPDLWTSRAPAQRKDQVPVQRTVDGITAWYLGDHVFASIGGNTLQVGNHKVLGTQTVQPWDEVDKSTWDVAARLALLDQMGVYAQILYPNAVGFASNSMLAIEDIALRNVVQESYNDFLVDVQHQSGNRLFPQAVLPVWDMDLTVREMTRLRDQGITGFTISDKPHLIGLPDLDAPYFAPMWSLANDMGAVINFHIGSGGLRQVQSEDPAIAEGIRRGSAVAGPNPDLYWDSFGPQRRLAILATQFYMSNVRIIINLCMSNMFDRYPSIKIASAESGVGWVPFVLEAIEYQLDEMVTDPTEVKLTQRRPTEYFHDHIYVTFWFEKIGPTKLIEDVGVNNVMVETDIPHPTCIYPGTKERIASVMAELDPHTRRRILQDNAIEAYQLPISVGDEPR
jgi:predicted TIM-barrel fold metal-dependent hydrolase